LPAPHQHCSTLRVGADAMTLIAEKDGQEVAKIHGPHRTEFVLEYCNPENGQTTKVSRTNLHALRSIAERVFPELVWKD
jgi:hypothetical protein